jgi:hypothetical protein
LFFIVNCAKNTHLFTFYPPILSLVVPEASGITRSCVLSWVPVLKKNSKAYRRCKFFEMLSRLSFYAQTRGIRALPLRFAHGFLAVELVVVVDGLLDFQ